MDMLIRLINSNNDADHKKKVCRFICKQWMGLLALIIAVTC